MKVYIIRKWQSNTCGLCDINLPWKITSSSSLAISEIEKETLEENEKWKVEYSANPEKLIVMTKTLVTDGYWSCLDMLTKVVQYCEWPLYTYIVSEMEVITE